MNQNLLGLKTVIRTRDFEKAKNFYNEILGMTIVEEYDDKEWVKGLYHGV